LRQSFFFLFFPFCASPSVAARRSYFCPLCLTKPIVFATLARDLPFSSPRSKASPCVFSFFSRGVPPSSPLFSLHGRGRLFLDLSPSPLRTLRERKGALRRSFSSSSMHPFFPCFELPFPPLYRLMFLRKVPCCTPGGISPPLLIAEPSPSLPQNPISPIETPRLKLLFPRRDT